jgi:hypothetical protein
MDNAISVRMGDPVTEMSFRTHSVTIAAVTDLFQEKVKTLNVSSLAPTHKRSPRPANECGRVGSRDHDNSPTRTLKRSGLG